MNVFQFLAKLAGGGEESFQDGPGRFLHVWREQTQALTLRLNDAAAGGDERAKAALDIFRQPDKAMKVCTFFPCWLDPSGQIADFPMVLFVNGMN